MIRSILLVICFVLLLFESFGQNGNDSVPIPKNNKFEFGFHYCPTVSYNSGFEVVPGYDDGDHTAYSVYTNHNEKANTGFSLGLTVESPKFSKSASLSLGIEYERFNYTGTAKETKYVFGNQSTKEIEYSYEDEYMHFPLLLHFRLLQNKKSALGIYFGPSVGYFFSESNSVYSGNEYTDFSDYENISKMTLFGIAGIEFKTLNHLNVGIKYTSQLSSSPKGRRFGSLGLTIGVYF